LHYNLLMLLLFAMLSAVTQQKRLGLVLVLNLIMIAGLLVVGLTSHSLGVLAAGGDYAADSVAIAPGILAIQVAKHPHGHPKATTYVALINALVLLTVTALVVYEGIHRITSHSPQIHGLPVLIVSIIATIFMVIGAFILGKDAGKEDLHMRSVLLDTVSDGVASAAVAVSGGILFITGRFYWLDSALAVLIGLVIGFNGFKLLRDVSTALKAKTPLKIN
jgi:cobalt-zinc-cadmium efflux system protein